MPLPFRLVPSSFLRALLDAFEEGILLVEPTGRIAEVNTQALKWLAVSRDEVVEQPLSVFFPPEGRHETYWNLRNRYGVEQKMAVHEQTLVEGYRLIHLRPLAALHVQHVRHMLRQKAGQIFPELLKALMTPFEAFSLKLALEKMHRLTSTDWMAYYALKAESWELEAGCGDLPEIPLSVPVEKTTLNLFQQPQFWHARTRSMLPDTPLAQVIRAQPYLFTFPVGPPAALNGLLLAAYKEKPSAELLIPLMQSMAHLLAVWQRLHHQRTQMKITQARLSEQAQLGRHLWNLLPQPALIIDAQGLIVTGNPPVLHLLGYHIEEVQRLPAEHIVVVQERADLPRWIQQTFNQQRETALEGLHILRRSGEAFPADLRLIPLSAEHVLLLIHDRTPEVETITLTRHAQMGMALASYAHEIRNPLNNLSTGLEYLLLTVEDGELPEVAELRDTLQRMRQDIERLEEMSRHLLQKARPLEEVNLRRLDLAQVLHTLAHRLEPRLQRYNIHLLWKIPADLPPVCGDAGLLEQAFLNLLDNAIRALRQHAMPRQIVLQGQWGERYVEILIADNGPGIPEEMQKRIFEPFFTTRPDGHGLGLALVRKTITEHHGSITLESYPGQGTVFRIRLPRAAPAGC